MPASEPPPVPAAGYRVGSSARRHILGGDASGGGHRHGAGLGKSAFPFAWSDDDIINAIESVANDSRSKRSWARFGRVRAAAMRDGIRLIVIADPRNGEIITGFPG